MKPYDATYCAAPQISMKYGRVKITCPRFVSWCTLSAYLRTQRCVSVRKFGVPISIYLRPISPTVNMGFVHTKVKNICDTCTKKTLLQKERVQERVR